MSLSTCWSGPLDADRQQQVTSSVPKLTRQTVLGMLQHVSTTRRARCLLLILYTTTLRRRAVANLRLRDVWDSSSDSCKTQWAALEKFSETRTVWPCKDLRQSIEDFVRKDYDHSCEYLFGDSRRPAQRLSRDPMYKNSSLIDYCVYPYGYSNEYCNIRHPIGPRHLSGFAYPPFCHRRFESGLRVSGNPNPYISRLTATVAAVMTTTTRTNSNRFSRKRATYHNNNTHTLT